MPPTLPPLRGTGDPMGTGVPSLADGEPAPRRDLAFGLAGKPDPPANPAQRLRSPSFILAPLTPAHPHTARPHTGRSTPRARWRSRWRETMKAAMKVRVSSKTMVGAGALSRNRLI